MLEALELVKTHSDFARNFNFQVLVINNLISPSIILYTDTETAVR